MLHLNWLNPQELKTAQEIVAKYHYLHTPVDVRTTPQGYFISHDSLIGQQGILLFGRPEATKCYPFYGSVEDVVTGKAEVTRWQVLNLSRVWISPELQKGGRGYSSIYTTGFLDRKGNWQSTLPSTIINQALQNIVIDYLVSRPPVFLNEPYQLEYVISYCDTKKHKGTIYKAAGFELYRTNADGIQTWRKRLRPLTFTEQEQIIKVSLQSPRAKSYRAQRANEATQLALF